MRPPRVEIESINLALQGGGAHGAFTWGVLDRLIEDDRIGFDGISATSGAAMNATVFASGMAAGDREGAKKALVKFWRRISPATSTSPLQPTLLDRLLGHHSTGQSRGLVFSELMTRLSLPYEFNPLGQNPLRDALLELPRSSIEILNRVNEISFNSSLIREMRAIRFVTQLIDDGYVANGSLRRIRIHTVAEDDVMTKLSVASKLDADWEFLTRLRDISHDRARQWLDAHFDRLGIQSTVDLQAVYM
jgi:predicted acylesterase/phospholipase RssA